MEGRFEVLSVVRATSPELPIVILIIFLYILTFLTRVYSIVSGHRRAACIVFISFINEVTPVSYNCSFNIMNFWSWAFALQVKRCHLKKLSVTKLFTERKPYRIISTLELIFRLSSPRKLFNAVSRRIRMFKSPSLITKLSARLYQVRLGYLRAMKTFQCIINIKRHWQIELFLEFSQRHWLQNVPSVTIHILFVLTRRLSRVNKSG